VVGLHGVHGHAEKGHGAAVGGVAPALVNLVLKSGFVGGCVKMSCLRIELT
jgi:hypothetical protein